MSSGVPAFGDGPFSLFAKRAETRWIEHGEQNLTGYEAWLTRVVSFHVTRETVVKLWACRERRFEV